MSSSSISHAVLLTCALTANSISNTHSLVELPQYSAGGDAAKRVGNDASIEGKLDADAGWTVVGGKAKGLASEKTGWSVSREPRGKKAGRKGERGARKTHPAATCARPATRSVDVARAIRTIQRQSAETAPQLARGPGWTTPFSARRQRTSVPCVPVSAQKLAAVESTVQVAKVDPVVEEPASEPTIATITEAPLVKAPSSPKRVMWRDECEDTPLADVQLIENCLVKSWRQRLSEGLESLADIKWRNCIDPKTSEGSATLGLALWYGAVWGVYHLSTQASISAAM